ncbi:MAG: low molecular weight protein arginine phosphatase [Candidatus Eisenbacteria bacterium]|nr:low molecular weight protein arginine phosphatase [Candidatus Eisenbacteria bacterium]
MPFSVLFVCTGNSCRSPMAEGMLRSMLPAERDDIEVGSAGTAGIDGMPATPEAVEVCLGHGIDISEHSSRGLTRELIDDSDLIFALADHHLATVSEIAPGARTRSYLLSQFADGSEEDVPDPIGAPVEEYERVYRMMDGYLRDSLPRVLMLADRKTAGAGDRPGPGRAETGGAGPGRTETEAA